MRDDHFIRVFNGDIKYFDVTRRIKESNIKYDYLKGNSWFDNRLILDYKSHNIRSFLFVRNFTIQQMN